MEQRKQGVKVSGGQKRGKPESNDSKEKPECSKSNDKKLEEIKTQRTSKKSSPKDGTMISTPEMKHKGGRSRRSKTGFD